jgi:hypothetical protein
MIPLDGKIISGETTVDDYRRTHPKDKRPGAIFCRNTQQNGFIEIKLLPSPSIPPLLK